MNSHYNLSGTFIAERSKRKEQDLPKNHPIKIPTH